MTLQQEAYKKIDKMSDDAIRMILDLIDKMQSMTVSDFNTEMKTQDKPAATGDIVDTIDENALKTMSKEEKKTLFLRSRGNMHIDVRAIDELRKRSVL
ncbi:MAG: hypothetical protein IJQ12_02350 [Lachnospiraceae bacterium]|nr:hypothetical protein [Lachnospiraceae bacterium]